MSECPNGTRVRRARARDASGRLDVGRARERARGVSRDAREDGGDERGVRGMSESSGVRVGGGESGERGDGRGRGSSRGSGCEGCVGRF